MLEKSICPCFHFVAIRSGANSSAVGEKRKTKRRQTLYLYMGIDKTKMCDRDDALVSDNIRGCLAVVSTDVYSVTF